MRPISLVRRTIVLTSVACTAVLIGLVGSFQVLAHEENKGSLSQVQLIPPPQTMDELVAPADLIIIGTVGRVVQQGEFAGYDPTDAARNERPSDLVSSRLPYTDFEIKVEKVLLDDGTVQAGRPVLLRMLGGPTTTFDATSVFPQARPGDRHLFVLGQNPDKMTYGLYYGPYSRLVIDTPVVSYSDGLRTPVKFTSRQGPPDFVADLTAAVARKRAAKP